MFRIHRIVALLCLAAGMPLLQATENAIRAGVQVAALVPTSPDLKLTTGSPGVGAGFHLDIPVREGLLIRPRLEVQFFSAGDQHSQDVSLDQTLKTRVRSLGIGADVLTTLPGLPHSLQFGLSVQELRWQVASVNTVRVAGGSSEVSGTSTWWRFAWGPLVSVRVNEHCELEARLSLSRYGQENQLANTAALGVLWHF